MQISYNYEELIKEIEQDIEERLFTDDTIYIVRDFRGMIIDYYYNIKQSLNERELIEEYNVHEILQEMKAKNKIL